MIVRIENKMKPPPNPRLLVEKMNVVVLADGDGGFLTPFCASSEDPKNRERSKC